ncbi:MAG: hypothetical protein GX491_19915 [Chloroflexi bacterium]|nr:hypothetical protein [Chloroflexota bacterium]
MRRQIFLYFKAFSLLLVLALAAVPAQPAGAEGLSQQGSSHNMAVFFIAPLVDIYEGDTITLPYFLEDLSKNGGITLAPLTPGAASVSAQLGTATAAPEGITGLSGTILYTANKAGQESITLTVSNYFGTATGTFEFTVKPRPNYDLEIFAISEGQSEGGGGFRTIFTGKGEFANVPETAIQGQGSSEAWFTLWVSNEVIQCKVEPPIQGTAAFRISGGMPAVIPLIRPPGFIDPFTLNLDFDPMPMNGSSVVCAGLGGFGANFPIPATTADPNEFNLREMEFAGEGGVFPIKAEKTWGFVYVTRKDQ